MTEILLFEASPPERPLSVWMRGRSPVDLESCIPVRNGKGMSAPRDEGPRGRMGAALCGVAGPGGHVARAVHTPLDRRGRRGSIVDGIQRGQMYLAGLDPVVGCEQGGVRPVLVIQNNAGNRHARTVIVAAVTSRCKPGLPTHVALPAAGVLTKGSTAMLEQIRTVDKSRLLRLLGTLDRGTMRRVDAAIAASLGLRGTADVMTRCGRCARTRRCAARWRSTGPGAAGRCSSPPARRPGRWPTPP